jgi:hypothetical protein
MAYRQLPKVEQKLSALPIHRSRASVMNFLNILSRSVRIANFHQAFISNSFDIYSPVHYNRGDNTAISGNKKESI